MMRGPRVVMFVPFDAASISESMTFPKTPGSMIHAIFSMMTREEARMIPPLNRRMISIRCIEIPFHEVGDGQ
jgi:hypothetical protein